MYQIYLDNKENNQFAKLDTDTIDMTTVFAISDINDISKRKDTVSKNLTFQGTERNNKAFGFAYMVNKNIVESDTTDVDPNGLLFWNYNSQILVDAYVYENDLLLLKGSLRLLKINRNANGTKSYDCVITGDLIDFKDMLGDKVLSDLDLSEMTHTFNTAAILYNWNNDPKTMGYVYPLIHNGYPFASNTSVAVSNVNPFQVNNFKPAVFVSTILDKIFADSNIRLVNDDKVRVGAAYNWKVEGSERFKTLFSNLIIPNNQAVLSKISTYDGTNILFKLIKLFTDTKANSYITNVDFNKPDFGYGVICDCTMSGKNDTLGLMTVGGAYGTVNNGASKKNDVVYNIAKSFKSTGVINYSMTYFNKYSGSQPIQGTFYLLERDVKPESDATAYNDYNGWDSLASDTFTLNPSGGTNVTHTAVLQIPERDFKIGRQIKVCFSANTTLGNGVNMSANDFGFSINDIQLNLPNVADATITTYEGYGQSITPVLPTGIKQLDFLNSLRNLFNLYTYTDTDTRTVVFEQYDEYYSRTKGLSLMDSALDWSYKIDNTGASSLSANTDIPKNYSFTFKSDSDYINDYYYKKYQKNIGDYSITDSKGISATAKKVELIFSPTATVLAPPNVVGKGGAGINIPIPWIYKVNGTDVAPLDTNIRILHYNGVVPLQNGNQVTIISEAYQPKSNDYAVTKLPVTSVALASNYVMGADFNPVYDLHFGVPDETYWKRFPDVPTSFSNYLNQINELKNPNVLFYEGEAYLNEIDINQLDLSVPVFIDFGADGHSYWKVLEIQYTNNARSSTIKLQKIIV